MNQSASNPRIILVTGSHAEVDARDALVSVKNWFLGIRNVADAG
jgi:hypothetical protein